MLSIIGGGVYQVDALEGIKELVLAKEIAADTPFFDLFLRFNCRLLKLLGAARLELSVNESHVLAEVASGELVTAKDISNRLSVGKSTISRTISALSSRGLLKASKNRADRRAKVLNLTPAGLESLRSDLQVRSQVIERCVAPLSEQQQERLANYLRIMADGLNSSVISEAGEEHPVERQVRRLTRALGILGTDFCGTGWPIERCQVMMALFQARGEVQLFELKRAMPYEFSTLSRLVAMLEKEGLLEKRISSSDRRAFVLKLTSFGEKQASYAAGRAEKFLLRSIECLSPQENSGFLQVLEVFLDESRAAENPALILIGMPQNEKERIEARVFLVEQLVKRGLHYELGAALLDAEGICYVLKVERHVQGVGEITYRNSMLELTQFIIDENPNRSAQARLLIEALKNEAMVRFNLSRVRIGPNCDRVLLEQLCGAPLAGQRCQLDLAKI